jgi:hypothetical protein
VERRGGSSGDVVGGRAGVLVGGGRGGGAGGPDLVPLERAATEGDPRREGEHDHEGTHEVPAYERHANHPRSIQT